MATGIAFLLVCIAVGYAGYWALVNEKIDPNGGYEGWFAMTRPKQKGPPAQIGPATKTARPRDRH